ncbi:hypothetical protein [Comamonas thiooxydans]|uniref:hypothetical protein n=1 Tax=Comamonas thiooxydans TaxID=363952 RepID=UPI0010398F3D|nr:hypothetical protein [Comamonas thiooxydans]
MSFNSKLKVISVHFSISTVFIAVIAFVVFRIWFPYPYYEISNGGEIFLITFLVIMICGPLLTSIIYSSRKKFGEIFLDMTIIAAVQLCAMIYSIYILAEARPVYTVFEVDRIRVVTSSEITKDKIPLAPPSLQNISWSGPELIGVRDPKDSYEYLISLEMSLNGMPPSVRPDWWLAHAESKEKILKSAHELSLLYKYRGDKKNIIDDALASKGYSQKDVLWLPLTTNENMEWVAFVDKVSAKLVAYIEVDGFIDNDE